MLGEENENGGSHTDASNDSASCSIEAGYSSSDLRDRWELSVI
jgi:hypothetical protein